MIVNNGKLMVGNCLDKLKRLPDCSIDSIVTDPPYEIGFMGKSWDGSGIAYKVELWEECLRVLKPGGFRRFQATRRLNTQPNRRSQNSTDKSGC